MYKETVFFEGKYGHSDASFSGIFTNIKTGVSYQIKNMKKFPYIKKSDDQEIIVSFKDEEDKSVIVIKNQEIVDFRGSKYQSLMEDLPIVEVTPIKINEEVVLSNVKVFNPNVPCYDQGSFTIFYNTNLKIKNVTRVLRNNSISVISSNIVENRRVIKSLGDDMVNIEDQMGTYIAGKHMLNVNSFTTILGWTRKSKFNYHEGCIIGGFECLDGVVAYPSHKN